MSFLMQYQPTVGSVTNAWKILNSGKVPDSLDELMYLQECWKREQFSSLAAYLAKKGETIDGDGGWPIQHIAYEAS